jgi:glycosyltransferase involved in cell wall biosynthesis
MNTYSKPTKVIIVDTFDPNKSPFHAKPNEDLFYVASWGGLWARRLKKRYPELDIEVWRPEPDFETMISRKAFGVDCTIFPTKGMIISKTITIEMLRRLYKYNRHYSLVMHRNDVFDWRFNIVMPAIFPGAKFILSHHGGTFPNKSFLKDKIKRNILILSYRRINSVTYLRDVVKQEIKTANRKIDATFLPVGADFETFFPMNKNESREKLNLSRDTVYAVYVGKFYKLKGVDHILKIFNKLKDRNFEVLFVGGSGEDELYRDVINTGCRHWGYINHDLLRVVYSAADFYMHPAFDTKFGGIDVSWMEALACNRPVMTPFFKEVDFDYSGLGLLVDHEDIMLTKTKEMIESYPQYLNCREAAMNHFDGNTSIIDKLYEIYNNQTVQE